MSGLVRLRASSLGELMDCAMRWAAKNLDNIYHPTTAPAWLGTSLHASTAIFDQASIDNLGLTADDTADVLIDHIWRPEEEVIWGDVNQKQAEKIGLTLHTKYCNEIAPYQNYTAVEITCDSLAIEDLGILLTGTTDRIYIDENGGEGIADIKSGKQAVGSDGKAKTKHHKEQMGVYELLASHQTGKTFNAPAKVIGLKTQGKAVTGVGTISNASQALIGNEHHKGLLERASDIIKSGDFNGNPRSMMCTEKYCPVYNTCAFVARD